MIQASQLRLVFSLPAVPDLISFYHNDQIHTLVSAVVRAAHEAIQ